MKRGYILLLLLFLSPALFGQEKTLISGRIENGGFGGPTVKLTQFNGDFAVMAGGRGAWIINHVISIGGGGYGVANDVPVGTSGPDTSQYLNMGYGGFELGFILSSRELIHLEINTLIGAGGVSYRSSVLDSEIKVDTNGDSFFILEPSVNAELNVTTYFRITAGLSYRFTSGARYGIIDDAYLQGFSGVITFKFGSF